MKNDYNVIFWIHALFVLSAYVSPLFLTWYYIFIGAIILQTTQITMNGCFLTTMQFGRDDKNLTFVGYYLKKWGIIENNNLFTKIFIRYVVKIIVILIAIISQLFFNYTPILF